MPKREDIINHTDPLALTLAGKPQWLRDRLEWFRDLKFGLILHWAPYSQWDCLESWGLVPEDTWARREDMTCWQKSGHDLARFQKDYWALNRTFNPQQFDPTVWARAAADAGMRYVAFTTKHHDGFCMWDTQTTDYRITHPDCPFAADSRADIVRHVFDAFRAQNFAISAYFSKSDWHCPWYWAPDFTVVDRNPNYDREDHPEIWQKFVQFVHAQVRELMSDYGHIDTLWLDGGQVRPPQQDIDMPGMAAMARTLQPGLLIADRTVGGDYEDFITPEQEVLDKPIPYPWEACLTLGNSWKYCPGKMDYKPAREIIHSLADVVAKGGNLLLGIGPSPAGTFDDAALERLAEIGKWMAVNQDAIYGTRPIAPYMDENIRYTSKGDRTYAIILAATTDTAPATVRLTSLRPAPGSDVTLLGHSHPLAWRDTEDGAIVTLPVDALPCQHAWTLSFQSQPLTGK